MSAAAAEGKSLGDIFRYQFALTPKTTPRPPDFRSFPFGSHVLHVCPDLPVAWILDDIGERIAVCLGIAVDGAGKVVGDRRMEVVLGRAVEAQSSYLWSRLSGRLLPGRRSRQVVPLEVSDADYWARIEAFVCQLAGRYVLIAANGPDIRVFGDPSGSMPCVYDPRSGIVASSLLMCLNQPVEDNPAVNVDDALSGRHRFPFGHTADRHVRRARVNHVLSLTDMDERRFWPPEGAFAPAGDDEIPAVIDAIIARLKAVTGGIIRSHPALLALSGGNDSRNILACVQDDLRHLRGCFSHAMSRVGRMDMTSAELVAAKRGLRLTKYDSKDRKLLPRRAVLRRRRLGALATGFAVTVPRELAEGIIDDLPDGMVVLRGNVMEALRAAHWKTDTPPPEHDPVFGLKRCLIVHGVNFTPDFIDRWLPDYQAWYDALSADAQAVSFDIAFLEENLPNLGFTYLTFQRNFFVNPFNDRELVTLAARLPLAYRYSNQCNRDILARAASDLADVPFARDLMATRDA